ncbi:MAG: hypothetical protein ABIQ54_01950 [Gammaproteobacteria bacterium]
MTDKMNMRLIVCTLLACLLLVVQQGAAVHALSHLSSDVPAQSQQDPQTPDLDLHTCEKCTGYAGLSATLYANPMLFNGRALSLVQIYSTQFFVTYYTLLPYYSRAPPQLVR